MHFKLENLNPAMRAQAEAQVKGHVVKPHKMRAVPTEVGEMKFGSRKEAARWLVLREQERRGDIQNLLAHGRIELVVNGHSICFFEPDAMYEKGGKLHAEDTKGRKSGNAWQMYLVKANLFFSLHGTRVITI